MKKIAKQQKFTLGEVEINLDSDLLKFNEQNLSMYYQHEGGYYDYFSAQLAYADYLLSKRVDDYDFIYNEKFVTNKELGGSDKYVEAKSKSDADVVVAKSDVALAKYKRGLLHYHLKAWDKNHDNALNLGHNLRKEMEKLGLELKGNRVSFEEEQEFTSAAPQELNLNELKD